MNLVVELTGVHVIQIRIIQRERTFQREFLQIPFVRIFSLYVLKHNEIGRTNSLLLSSSSHLKWGPIKGGTLEDWKRIQERKSGFQRFRTDSISFISLLSILANRRKFRVGAFNTDYNSGITFVTGKHDSVVILDGSAAVPIPLFFLRDSRWLSYILSLSSTHHTYHRRTQNFSGTRNNGASRENPHWFRLQFSRLEDISFIIRTPKVPSPRPHLRWKRNFSIIICDSCILFIGARRRSIKKGRRGWKLWRIDEGRKRPFRGMEEKRSERMNRKENGWVDERERPIHC